VLVRISENELSDAAWRERLRPALEHVGSQIEEIENAVRRKYGLSAAWIYRQCKYEFANDMCARERLSRYWRESAIEYLSAMGEVSDYINRVVPQGAYRSAFLDELFKVRNVDFELEPTLAITDSTYGKNRQAGYDHIRAAWESRAKEANEIAADKAQFAEKMNVDVYSAFRSALNEVSSRFLWVPYPRTHRKHPMVLYTTQVEGVQLLLTNHPSRKLENHQLDMMIMISPKGKHPDPRLLGREAGYIPVLLSRIFPGYRYGYGVFQNAAEFQLCVFASCALATEFVTCFGAAL
jgi:hypothetical protein